MQWCLCDSCPRLPWRRSPEVCERKPYGFQSDMWALGCILYELCTLKRAFHASNIFLLAYNIVNVRLVPAPVHKPDFAAVVAVAVAVVVVVVFPLCCYCCCCSVVGVVASTLCS
jgi:serine/threonine protein kinase